MKPIKSIFLPVMFTLVLNGCIITGNQIKNSADAVNDIPSKRVHADKKINKEYLLNNIIVSLDIPPILINKESDIDIKLKNLQNNALITDASIIAEIQKKDIKSVEYQISGNKETGNYILKHKFDETGIYKINLKISLDVKDNNALPLNLQTTCEVID